MSRKRQNGNENRSCLFLILAFLTSDGFVSHHPSGDLTYVFLIFRFHVHDRILRGIDFRHEDFGFDSGFFIPVDDQIGFSGNVEEREVEESEFVEHAVDRNVPVDFLRGDLQFVARADRDKPFRESPFFHKKTPPSFPLEFGASRIRATKKVPSFWY